VFSVQGSGFSVQPPPAELLCLTPPWRAAAGDVSAPGGVRLRDAGLVPIHVSTLALPDPVRASAGVPLFRLPSSVFPNPGKVSLNLECKDKA